jgi:hypothetical protein
MTTRREISAALTIVFGLSEAEPAVAAGPALGTPTTLSRGHGEGLGCRAALCWWRARGVTANGQHSIFEDAD